jgi:hypothetical protein
MEASGLVQDAVEELLWMGLLSWRAQHVVVRGCNRTIVAIIVIKVSLMVRLPRQE